MKEKRLLVTGANGFAGSNFVRVAAGVEDISLVCPSHTRMDITNIKPIQSVVEETRPDVIVHFAAHRNANTAEEQRGNKFESAWMNNVGGSENLAYVSETFAIPFIYISSDMVFAGYSDHSGLYSENDLPESNENRLSWYGWTKRLGELAVLPYATVIRIGNVTQPIYHPSLDYIGKVLWRFDTNNPTPMFIDQMVTLTDMSELNRSILKIIKDGIHGIFHVASCDTVTPFELAEYLLQMARPSKRYRIESGSIDDYLKKFPNRYPKHGGLRSQYTQNELGLSFMEWRGMVRNFVKKAL